jgi:hypothetical protein
MLYNHYIMNSIEVDPYCEACPLVVKCIDRVGSLATVRTAQVEALDWYIGRTQEDAETHRANEEEILQQMRARIGELDTAEAMRFYSQLIEDMAEGMAERDDVHWHESMTRLNGHMTTIALTDAEADIHRGLAHDVQQNCRSNREKQATRGGRFLLSLKSTLVEPFTMPAAPVSGCSAPKSRIIESKANHQLRHLSDVRIARMKQGWF